MELRTKAFENEERARQLSWMYSLAYRIWASFCLLSTDGVLFLTFSQLQNIDSVRNQTTPIYTFTMFRKLSVQIQLGIWLIAARSNPQTHRVLSLRLDSRRADEYPDELIVPPGLSEPFMWSNNLEHTDESQIPSLCRSAAILESCSYVLHGLIMPRILPQDLLQTLGYHG